MAGAIRVIVRAAGTGIACMLLAVRAHFSSAVTVVFGDLSYLLPCSLSARAGGSLVWSHGPQPLHGHVPAARNALGWEGCLVALPGWCVWYDTPTRRGVL